MIKFVSKISAIWPHQHTIQKNQYNPAIKMTEIFINKTSITLMALGFQEIGLYCLY